MPRLVTKFKYLKPSTRMKAGGYAKYIATREGAEKIDESQKHLPATEKQKKLIRRILRDFPDCKSSHEYADYLRSQTSGNASEFISRSLEEHADEAMEAKTYADYIATRPRAERFGSHGLFTDDGVPVQLSKVSKDLNEHAGNVWTPIISIRREDAARLGYDHGKRWRDMLRSQTQNFSEAFHIPMQNLKWYAAFHNETHHPHVHLIVYSANPNEGFLSPAGVEKLRSALARDIFAQDLENIYEKQTEHRDALRVQGKDAIAEIVSSINRGVYDNSRVENLLQSLAWKLESTSGKKVYGYLKADVKGMVDSIVEELAKDPRIAQLYDLWYQQREAVLKTYTDEMPERISLSANGDFKSIKNAVIREAQRIIRRDFPVEKPAEPKESVLTVAEPDEAEEEFLLPIPNDRPASSSNYSNAHGVEVETDLSYTATESEKPLRCSKAAIDFNSYAFRLYQAAKQLLRQDSEEYDPEKAITLLTVSAEQGLSLAQYRLGKMLLLGTDTEPSPEDGVYWLALAANQGNEWAQYLLGKTLLQGKLVEQDTDRARELLEASYQQGNRYAAYTLGKAYLDGAVLPQDIPAAVEHLRFSAEKDFQTAQYIFGKLLYQGELLPQDIPAALKFLEAAAEQNNSFAAALAAKIYLTEESCKSIPDAIRLFKLAAENGSDYAEYQLGRLYLFGEETAQDIPWALYWLDQAADHGNQYAAQLLHSYHSGGLWSCSLGALRLLQQLARTFEQRQEDENRNIRFMKAERKLLQKIEEKRQAHGLKHG